MCCAAMRSHARNAMFGAIRASFASSRKYMRTSIFAFSTALASVAALAFAADANAQTAPRVSFRTARRREAARRRSDGSRRRSEDGEADRRHVRHRFRRWSHDHGQLVHARRHGEMARTSVASVTTASVAPFSETTVRASHREATIARPRRTSKRSFATIVSSPRTRLRS